MFIWKTNSHLDKMLESPKIQAFLNLSLSRWFFLQFGQIGLFDWNCFTIIYYSESDSPATSSGADFGDFVVLTPDEVSIAHFCPNAGTKTRQGVAFFDFRYNVPRCDGVDCKCVNAAGRGLENRSAVMRWTTQKNYIILISEEAQSALQITK